MVDPKAADRESFTGTGQLRTGAGDPAADLKALSRYSPNRTDTTIRPGWHRIAGWFGVVLALVIVTPNDAIGPKLEAPAVRSLGVLLGARHHRRRLLNLASWTVRPADGLPLKQVAQQGGG